MKNLQKINKLTFYLFSCATSVDVSNGDSGNIHTGSLWHENSNGVLSDQAPTEDEISSTVAPKIEEELVEFPKGWKPIHYE